MIIRETRAVEEFVNNITGAGDSEVREYIIELEQDKAFREALDANMWVFGKRSYSLEYSIGKKLAGALYAICRINQPDLVVETGVGSGVSSSRILCALEKNGRGRLYSIDVPWWQEEKSGWLIPDYLRGRWDLLAGRSAEKLSPLLEQLGEIDIFLHDSDHNFRNMMWEFRTAWRYLKKGDLLLSHNIDDNRVFSDFCSEIDVKGVVLDNMGGVLRP
ncbi:class I SAM-dependent methyltransferase [Chloroflexota bacterium]